VLHRPAIDTPFLGGLAAASRGKHALQNFRYRSGCRNHSRSGGGGRGTAAGSRADVRRDIRPEHSLGTGWVSSSVPGRDQPLPDDYTDQITINIDVGWGEIDGNPLNPGNLGQKRTNQAGNFTYSQVRNALINEAKSAADFQAISTLGVTDPTGGRAFRMSDAGTKTLGFRAANARVSTAG
jgi:hypothetical protein